MNINYLLYQIIQDHIVVVIIGLIEKIFNQIIGDNIMIHPFMIIQT